MTAEEFANKYHKENSTSVIIQNLRVVMNNKNQFHALPSNDSNLVLVFDKLNKLIFAEVK
jgi:hypothetical protein